MAELPVLEKKHKICVICEGYEDIEYFNRLLELGVCLLRGCNLWNDAEKIKLKWKNRSRIEINEIKGGEWHSYFNRRFTF